MKILEKGKTFFREVAMEAKKIDWPSRKQVIEYAELVIGISVFVAIVLGVFDFVFAEFLKRFIS